ncbi:MAG TPA: alcohol dehydrogenase catalytic domain-containing protein, partial [Candidatus Brevibacterium intestinavium]|nr:alcohol dehydrogenase catalytic domain-containing protein [Candidatus Brevibacterium intestinavium]
MSEMKAAVVEGFGQELVVGDNAIPEPGPGQALVKLIASGVCHTDLHASQGDWPVKPKIPLIPGHEGVGTVEKVGPGVTDVEVGQMVGNAWLWTACGTCEHCRQGWETLCEQQINGGYGVDGSFGEYMLVDTRFAAAIPDGADPYEIAPLLCAG